MFDGGPISGLSEWQLLERYVESRDETAFEAMVTRHGPMVLGVCRRALGFSPDADDAFQATFLVLIRRARELGPRDAIGPWLYGVATRVAARARVQASRRRQSQAIPLEFPVVDRGGATIDPDLVEILDAELGRLPSKYRSPLVLCYLEGRTHEEAARDLQWPVGTVKGRLARARELLRSRLTRRGFSPAAGGFGIISSADLKSILDRMLIERTVDASARLAAGQSITHVVSQSVTSLVEGALASMFANKIKWALLVAVTTGAAFTSAAVLGRQPTHSEPEPQVKGSIELPKQKSAGKDGLTVVPIEHPPATAKAGPLGHRYGIASTGSETGRASDPRSRKIIEKLEEPISMSFANETPLDDILKYVKQATTTPTYSGIPIYVDPIGLQEAERSLQSTIQIDLEGVPLRRTLQLALAQIGLVYFVEDGILVVTSEESEAQSHLPPAMARPSPFMETQQKAERGELSLGELQEWMEYSKLRNEAMQVASPHEGAEKRSAGETTHPNAEQTAELIKELRELIQLLKAERTEKKPADSTRK